MIRNERGFSIYKVITILSFLVLVFVLALPQFFNLEKKEKTEQCVSNMENIYRAVQQYMFERNEEFNVSRKQDTSDLKRTGFLSSVLECPEKGPGDNYVIIGRFADSLDVYGDAYIRFLDDEGKGKLVTDREWKDMSDDVKKQLIIIEVSCPNFIKYPDEFPDHVLPESFK
ncbi:MAG: hypothetical protein K8R90_10040 [Candidatus Cloacimonetes bacterium]|nr:hypothetical protein [Candidatus Cloacimonadota bacterium]